MSLPPRLVSAHMADESKNAKAGEKGVMANLPSTRPSRLSRRGREDGQTATATPPKPRRKPAPKKAAPKKPALKAVPPAAPSKPKRPRPVRAATPNLTESAATANENREPAEERAEAKSQSGKDLATTVVQAAGELAQIGVSMTGQLLKRAVDKLPKP